MHFFSIYVCVYIAVYICIDACRYIVYIFIVYIYKDMHGSISGTAGGLSDG